MRHKKANRIILPLMIFLLATSVVRFTGDPAFFQNSPAIQSLLEDFHTNTANAEQDWAVILKQIINPGITGMSEQR